MVIAGAFLESGASDLVRQSSSGGNTSLAAESAAIEAKLERTTSYLREATLRYMQRLREPCDTEPEPGPEAGAEPEPGPEPE